VFADVHLAAPGAGLAAHGLDALLEALQVGCDLSRVASVFNRKPRLPGLSC